MSGIDAAFFGTLGRDGEAKTSKSGKSYVRLNVRIGEGDAAQWINETAFDPQAIADTGKLVKGSRVYCEGSLSLDKWKTQDGTERQSLSCTARLTRLPTIGRNKPKREREPDEAPLAPRNDFHSGSFGISDTAGRLSCTEFHGMTRHRSE
jgi:single-stranded DNA-binding protein